jgi:hypothetical protein
VSKAAEVDSELFDGGPTHKLLMWLGWVKRDKPSIAIRAGLVILIGWVPLAVHSAMQGVLLGQDTRLFLLDIGVHARSLIAAPLFVLAESVCLPRLGAIAQYFLDAGLVVGSDRARFDGAVSATKRLRESRLATIVIIALTYAIVAALLYYVPTNNVSAWHRTAVGLSVPYSLAGWWHVLVSLPLLLILFFGWMWRMFLWTRFLRLMSRLDLRLIPVHPDYAAGLKFVGYSVRAFSVLGFALGVIVAGRIANNILQQGEPPADFIYVIVGLTVFVVALFTGPLLVFMGKLLRVWQRGTLEYGALADKLGRQFERKWFDRAHSVDEKVLGVQDFSAMTDLYQTVSNVYNMFFVPVDLKSLALLIVATLLPFLPVALMTVPLNVLLAKLASLLL